MGNAEKIRAKGRLRVYAVNEGSGASELLFDEHNQITYGHLTMLVGLATQTAAITDPTELAIYKMDIEAGAIAIAAAAPGDTGPALPDVAVVKSHVFDKAIDVSFPGGLAGLVRFQASIGASESNGVTLRAAGLYTQGDGMGGSPVLVARKVITPIVKPDGLSVRFEWDIQYAIG